MCACLFVGSFCGLFVGVVISLCVCVSASSIVCGRDLLSKEGGIKGDAVLQYGLVSPLALGCS